MAITQQHMTLEEFLELPEGEPTLEFEDGRVTEKVPPQGRHARLQPRICELINRVAESAELALAFSELRTTFAGQSRVPDVAVYRWDRIPVDESGDIRDDFREPPDIAIEIVSPGQGVNQMVTRCLWYTANGVGCALLVDPEHRSILAFWEGRAPVALGGAQEIDLTTIVPGLRLTVSDIFSALRLPRTRS